ncbi:MAG: hypothetical protein GY856_54875, partial [bacterium]|nr:hypothetical protein [bacterium]
TLVPSQSYTFETGTDGWTTIQGTFNRSSTGGGAGGTSWYEQSSASLDNQCDQIQSPVMVLTATSTLTLSNNYDIEPMYTNNEWYDRANIGIVDVATSSRTLVSPDGGRLYNATGTNGTCGTSGQDGWADAATTWAASTFSAAALGSAGYAGEEIQLDVRYGTDASLNGYGFRFDEVTVTDVSSLGADGQGDSCGCEVPADCDDGLWCNGAEDCVAGSCQAGTPPTCDDGVACTDDSCNEGTDSCDNSPNHATCDNGLYCDGTETCNATLDCQAGTAVNCDDGVGCTVDSCNEGTDQCDSTPNDAACDNGLFCDGTEVCDDILDCQDSSDPCIPPEVCDEVGDICIECTIDADCDDGLFCNGAETCSAGSCQTGSDPCPGQTCDEVGDVCSSQNGPQDAVYDAGLGAPKCAVAGSECDSLALLDGRDSVGPEPNQPNTLDSCTDGTSGSYHNDESNDALVVKTLDGADMVEGATVQVDATLYAWSTGTSDHLDLYYAADANSPVWTHITTIDLTSGGLQTLSAQYTLPDGTLQAVRANFRYNGSQSSCTTGSYDDADDLVFAVNPANPCTGDPDCDDGLFCNGAETCNAGTCQAGSDPCPGQSCDEVGDVCVPGGCVVDDDFEAGAPDWTNDPASTCTTGDYVTGDPTNASSGYQIVGSHSGVTSLFTATNSSAGVNDVDGGNCILGSPSWAVPNASTLSVWYWHGQRDAGDDASGDFFYLEYSTNGGSSWTTLASNGDSTSNPAWLNATAAIPAGSNVQLRMQCSDGPATGDLVECGIDDFSICD